MKEPDDPSMLTGERISQQNRGVTTYDFYRGVSKTINPFHNNIQFEAKDVISCTARNLHRIIMLQLHVQNNFMRCREQCTLLRFRSWKNFKRTDVILKGVYSGPIPAMTAKGTDDF